jgi:uncharacterized protein (TIRG00374 family)
MWLAVSAKLSITFALLAWLLASVDWTELLRLISRIELAPLVVSVFLLFIIVIPAARRWHLIVSALGGQISFRDAIRMVLMTVLLNQSVPSNLGGDAYRVVATSRAGMPWKRATLAAVVDRLIALVALAIVAFAGVFALVDQAGLKNQRLVTETGTIAIVGGTLAMWMFFRSKMAERLSGKLEILRRLILALGTLLSDPAQALYLLALSLIVQCVTIAAMSLVAVNASVHVPLWPMLGVCALGLLMARLPVSYGGWGVREGTLVLGFAPFGVSREAALAASIAYGLTELAAAVIGGLLWAALSVASHTKVESKRHAS